ncbi:RNA-binding protein NOB1 isoform X1 [Alosa sapidissima]|uniref:RNA-binding protein NOB1 isoform X1 n=1 Tax=Alosa sapidissima TaxID=34773 RepID=UPI001C0964BB|nr:RNA-binding protein NOB1 isoform X1 [Alosa sapidissima]
MDAAKVEHVVADAGAFLKKAPLQEIGKTIYTLKDVVNEIRDKPTKRSLSFLPYTLIFKDPFPEHVRFVTEFSKKTGDYPSLSATDIKVLALTYQLELENVGSKHLKSEPDVKVKVSSTQRHPEAPDNIAGFHFPHHKISEPNARNQANRETHAHCPAESNKVTSQDPDNVEFNSFQFWRTTLPDIEADILELLNVTEVKTQVQSPAKTNDVISSPTETVEFNSFQFWRAPIPSIDADLFELLGADTMTAGDGEVSEKMQSVHLSAEEHNTSTDSGKGKDSEEVSTGSQEGSEEREDDDDNEEEEEDDVGGGWITPKNIKQVKLDGHNGKPAADVKVGCVTTDFAMQNVLIQIGLNVLSVNGMLIKQTRNYILRCHACFKTTTNMNKTFCPHCGNNTLKKVAVTISEDGSTQMHFSRNPKVLNPKGMRYSLPKPQGGKHASNPHLVEDQQFPQQRVSRKARQKTDVFDPDYVAGNSPFIENDIYSRSATLHIRDTQGSGGGRRRSNPNAARKKFVKKK